MKTLRETLEQLKAGQPVLPEAAAALANSQVLAPAEWDKDPILTADGNMVFPEGTNMSLMVLEQSDGTTWFPMFTSPEKQKAYNPDLRCLVLNFPQLMQFIHMAGKDINGILLDPQDLSATFETNFLKQLEQTRTQQMHQNQLKKGDKVTIRKPGAAGQAMEAALKDAGSHMDDVLSLYLFQRIMPDKSIHWLIVVGMNPENPARLKEIARYLNRAAGGMGLEFLFDSTSIGSKIAAAHDPVWQKNWN